MEEWVRKSGVEIAVIEDEIWEIRELLNSSQNEIEYSHQ
jgi:hypothetical protein